MPVARTALWLVLGALLAGCGAAPAAAGDASPVPFGTPRATATASAVPPSPTPYTRCRYAADLGGSQGLTEVGYYLFDWQGIAITLDTREGPLALTGNPRLALGNRAVIVPAGLDLSTPITLPDALVPGTVLVLAPNGTALAVREAGGRVLYEALRDDQDEHRGMPDNLDIVLIERIFGAGDDHIVRVHTRAADDGEYIWNFEQLELLLGPQRYTARTTAQGQVIGLRYDSDGEPQGYDGMMIVSGPTVTWGFAEGGTQPFAAQSATSSANWDETVVFPADTLFRLWQGALENCGYNR